MPMADILIVGAGPAGLTTAGALKQAGFEPILLDQAARIGQSWEQRYDRLHLHTVRAFSGLAHFPIPRSYPKYLSKDQYAEYLRSYASHFDLQVIPNTRVQRIRLEGPGWALETESGAWNARVVVITTGQYGQPVIPVWPGLTQFEGTAWHSSQYRSGRAFRGRRVLVIGAGNSGLEIAADLVEQGAAQTAVSLRAAPPVVPRDFLGTPAQVFGILLHSFPPGLSDKIGQAFARLAFGDLNRYGLPPPAWMPFAARRTPVIDVGFVSALQAGQIGIRPPVRSFTPTQVVFADQRQEPFDGVIFATGFRSGLSQLLEFPDLLDELGNPRFPSGAPTTYPGLYFMGFFESLRGFLFESNLASRRLARAIKANDLIRQPG